MNSSQFLYEYTADLSKYKLFIQGKIPKVPPGSFSGNPIHYDRPVQMDIRMIPLPDSGRPGPRQSVTCFRTVLQPGFPGWSNCHFSPLLGYSIFISKKQIRYLHLQIIMLLCIW